MPWRTYWLSVVRSTIQDFFRASSAEIAAISSMRLLVVWGSPPFNSFSTSPNLRIAPQPPGPGWIAQARDALLEAQLADIVQRVFWLDQRTRRHVEEIDQPCQQKTKGRAARQQRQRILFGFG